MLPASLIGFVCQPYGMAGIFSFGENHKTRLLAFSPSEKTTKHDSEREPFGCVLTHEMILKK